MKKTPRARIAQTIADKTLSQGSNKQLSKEIAAYLISERRVNDLNSLLRDVQADWATAGYVEVLASSAHPLTDKVKDDIMVQMRPLYPNAKEIMITEVRDEKVIGGVRLSLASQQLDLTVEAKLNRFKQLTAAGKE
jgi:F0F1-type ATP synthase delta subunit